MSIISSPRECAFSVPLMGEPFNPIGFIKPTTSSYNRRDIALMKVPQSGTASYKEQEFVSQFVPPQTARIGTRSRAFLLSK